MRVGLIGDHNESVPAHRAIPRALSLASEAVACPLEYEWVPTIEILSASRVAEFDGIWCVPASPYQSMEGTLRAIRWAREQSRPFLGTCGGFQHAILEYARNVLEWADAEHAETTPSAARAVIAPLACGLVEQTASIRFCPGSRIASAYGALEACEGYHCSYGINPAFQKALFSGRLRPTGHDAAAEVRSVEMDGHPFFVATLFQPERAALAGRCSPLVVAFVQAMAATRSRNSF